MTTDLEQAMAQKRRARRIGCAAILAVFTCGFLIGMGTCREEPRDTLRSVDYGASGIDTTRNDRVPSSTWPE